MNPLLAKTKVLDYDHPSIQRLIRERGWKFLSSDQRKKEIYKFVRDEIKFDYNKSDSISASEVLQDGMVNVIQKGLI